MTGRSLFPKGLAVLLLIGVVVDMSSGGDPKDKPVKNILAFGGNGFIGSEVLDLLFTDPEQYYSITLVSRGNWYFDSEERIKPKLHKQIICDREESDLEYCVDLVNYIKETEKIDVVLDFSAYNPSVLEATLEALQGDKVGLYVYISSDSIYEVCRNSKIPRMALEDDDQRPAQEHERAALNEADNYGNDKLLGEEMLRDPEKNKIPYVILRLPDVLGPRDTTDRWWTYQLWIQTYNFLRVPIQVPGELRNLKTSYVYVKDVAKAVLLAMNKPQSWNNAYNLALDETFTLQELIHGIAKEIGVKVDFDSGDFNLFPSVTRGSINTEKIKKALGFVPYTWDQLLKETVPFYNEGLYKFHSERDDAVHQLTRFVVPRHRKGEFLKMIDEWASDKSKTVDSFITSEDANSLNNEGVTADQLFEEMMHRTEL